MPTEHPDVVVNTSVLTDHREQIDVRDHEFYIEQGNWIVADISGVDNLFVCDLGDDYSGTTTLSPPDSPERVRIDIDGVSEQCDAFDMGHNVSSSVWLTEEMAAYLYSELGNILTDNVAINKYDTSHISREKRHMSPDEFGDRCPNCGDPFDAGSSGFLTVDGEGVGVDCRSWARLCIIEDAFERWGFIPEDTSASDYAIIHKDEHLTE